ncbi:MAG TPA: hypothetical protein VMW23_09395, partial [Sedimentisphaerales bacterium]|nr:hypothetical protein [Sedimentisphaerales bacterium]
MYRKTFFLVCCFVLACMAGSASAANRVWEGNVDTDWFNGDNWAPVGVPVGGTGAFADTVIINGGKSFYPVIDAAGAVCKKLHLGTVADGNEAYLTIETGGELTVNSGDTATENQTICLGKVAGAYGTLTMNGGQINMVIGEECEVGGRGLGGFGTYNVYGGLHKGGNISVPGYGAGGTSCGGVVNLDGGVIDSNQFVWATDTKTGTVNIYSGTLYTDFLGFNSGGYCNLYGGMIDSNDYKMMSNYGLFDIYDGIWYNHSQKPGTEFGHRATYDVRYYCNQRSATDPDPSIVAYGGRGPVSIEWEGWDLPFGDPNRVAESELRNLYLTDPNFVWWVRADFNSNLAYWPEPVDGFGAADPDQELHWSPSYTGNATHHDIYFGTSLSDVTDANLADPGGVYYTRQTVDNNSIARSVYSPSGPHTLGGVYYWRIDEVNEADEPETIWKGTVWTFSISYVILEDFESYASSAALALSWVPTGSSSTAAYLVPVSTPGPYLGEQSMLLRAYTNIGTVGPVWWGEARHTFAADQKWDPANTDARLLAFSVYGTATNSATIDIYVKLKDSLGNEAVRYVSGLAQTLAWTEVLFDLDAFTSPAVVDLSKVKQIAIGVKSDVKTALKTDVFVENVRLYLADCYPNYLWGNTDFNRDCITNMSDVGILVTTGNWLMSNWDVTPAAPAVGPVLKYEFNGDANDSSGNGYNATIYDDDGIQWEAGHLGENPGAL